MYEACEHARLQREHTQLQREIEWEMRRKDRNKRENGGVSKNKKYPKIKFPLQMSPYFFF